MAGIDRRVARALRQRGVTYYTRRGWGNTSPVYHWRTIFRKHAPNPSDTLWQHITVTHSEPIKEAAKTLHGIGMERFGSGISYNFLVHMKTGELAQGQSLRAKGTHTINDKDIPGYSYDQNLVSHAVACVGMPGDKLSRAAQNTISILIQVLHQEGALTRGFDYNPHSMVAWKDCPCDETRDLMEQMRDNAFRASRRH